MAITVVQHKSVSALSTTSSALAFTSNVTAGNLLIAIVACFGTITPAFPSDSQNNVYIQRAQENPGTSEEIITVYSAVATATGACTITAHVSPADTIHLHIYEVNSVSVLDQAGKNAQTATTAGTVSSAGATVIAAELVLAVFAQGNAQSTWTIGTGYSTGETTSATSNDCCFSEFKIVAATGTQTATATASASSPISSVIATFAATPQKQFLGLLGVGT